VSNEGGDRVIREESTGLGFGLSVYLVPWSSRLAFSGSGWAFGRPVLADPKWQDS